LFSESKLYRRRQFGGLAGSLYSRGPKMEQKFLSMMAVRAAIFLAFGMLTVAWAGCSSTSPKGDTYIGWVWDPVTQKSAQAFKEGGTGRKYYISDGQKIYVRP
jgi:hypothetical protein